MEKSGAAGRRGLAKLRLTVKARVHFFPHQMMETQLQNFG